MNWTSKKSVSGYIYHSPGSDSLAQFAFIVAAIDAAEAAIKKHKEKVMSELDFALAKQLDYELNAHRHDERSVSGSHRRPKGSQKRSVGLRATTDNLWHGPIEVQLERAKLKNTLLKKKVEDIQAAAFECQKGYQQEQVQHHRTYNQARALEMEFNAARKHIHALDEELKAVRNELTAVKLGKADAYRSSRERNGDSAQGFLSKADMLSVTDAVQKVNALNEEIFQLSAYLGEVVVYEVLEPNADRQEHRQRAIEMTYDCAINVLGETLASMLAQQSLNEPVEENSPLLVQIVIQIALTNWCVFFGSRWTSYRKVENELTSGPNEGHPGESSTKSDISKQIEYDRWVSELYDSIRDHGKNFESSSALSF